MPQLMPRSAWTAAGPAKAMARLVDPAGIALHWPGGKRPVGDPGAAALARILEGQRRYHVEVKGWSDIAYQLGVDQAGRVWSLRGIQWQPAANGDEDVNADWGAFTLLIGPGEDPSPAMIDAVRWARALWLQRYPRATQVTGHRLVHPGTECPGPAVMQLIRAGAFRAPWEPPPARPEEEEMILARAADTRRVYAVIATGAGERAVYVPDPALIRPTDRSIEFAEQAELESVFPILGHARVTG